MAAIYHFKLCRAILVGFRRQLKVDGICKDGYVGMMEAEPIVPLLHVGSCDQILDVEIDGGVVYRDDLTGQVLDPRLVRAARQKELDFFESKSVWSLKAFEEARRRTGKPPVTERWQGKEAGVLAYQDVKRAFQFYLENYNQGKPIIIASHSQGSLHAKRLLHEFFDGKVLQEKLIAAYLVGVRILPNEFKNIPVLNQPNETGGFVSWNTYKKNKLPKRYDYWCL